MGEEGSLELDVKPRLALILVLLSLPPKWDYYAQLKVTRFPQSLPLGVSVPGPPFMKPTQLTDPLAHGLTPPSFPVPYPQPGRRSNLQ